MTPEPNSSQAGAELALFEARFELLREALEIGRKHARNHLRGLELDYSRPGRWAAEIRAEADADVAKIEAAIAMLGAEPGEPASAAE